MPKLSPKRIFVSAGEPSGDETLGSVLEELRSHVPNFVLHGLGGSAAIKQGLSPLFALEKTAVSGIWDVLGNAAFLFGMYRRAVKEMIQFRPDLVLLVDYPGLNLRLASKARALGFQVLFVAPPQLWVYKISRRRKARTLRALKGCSVHVLFPFEVQAYASLTSPVTAGHFLRMASEKPEPKIFPSVTLPLERKGLSLFPGSRLPLILRNLPIWLEHLDFHFKSAKSSSIRATDIKVLIPEHLLGKVRSWLQDFHQGKYLETLTLSAKKEEVFEASNYAIAFPGTITLELLLHRIPTLIIAVIDPFTLVLGKWLLKFQHLGLPNLLLKDDFFPEWVGTGADLTNQIFSDQVLALQALKPDWAHIKNRMDTILGPEPGAKIAAGEGLRLLNCLEIGQKHTIAR